MHTHIKAIKCLNPQINTSLHFCPQKEEPKQGESAGLASISWLHDMWPTEVKKKKKIQAVHMKATVTKPISRCQELQKNKWWVHFFPQRLQVSSAETVVSSSSATFSLAIPQNLHVQFGQCQSPGGSICNENRYINT